MQRKPGTLKRILSSAGHRRKTVFGLFALVILYQAANILVPLISKIIIDALTGFIKSGGMFPWPRLAYAAAGILAATLFSNALNSNYNYRLFQLATKVEDELKNRAFQKYMQLHALYHHGASSGQVIGRIDRGATSLFTILYDILGHNFLPPLVISV